MTFIYQFLEKFWHQSQITNYNNKNTGIYFESFDEQITSQIIQQIVEWFLVASQSIIIVETVYLNLIQIELIARKHRVFVYIFG